MASEERETDHLLSSVNSTMSYNSQGSYTTRSIETVWGMNKCKYLLPGVMVLVIVLMERIAFYSLTNNLYLFLNQSDFHWMYYNSISALLIFTGTSYLSSLFGGWLSDALLGRFKTIVLGFVVFTAAYWFLPFMDVICSLCHNCPLPIIIPTSEPETPLFKELCSWPVMAILFIAALGTGTVKANITPFGAEQVRFSGSDGLRLYLNWLYWCVNIGSLVSILGIAYVQQDDGFHKGYIIPVILLSSAAVLFIISYPLYTHKPPCGSSFSRILSVIKDAWKYKRVENSSRSQLLNQPSWLDMAKMQYGGRFHDSVVDDVKSLSNITLVFITLIPYWILYFQMQTTFLAQGLQMRLNVFSIDSSDDANHSEFNIPAAWLMLFNVLFLIVFIPLMNHVIYPFLDRRGSSINILTRMAIGMVCATLSMVVAGCLEICRVNFINEGRIVNQTIEHTLYTAADLPILWQIPQYSLIGISEVFTSVSGMEFACSQAPSTMQGAVMGLYYFCTGIGSLVGVAMLRTFEYLEGAVIGHHSNDPNNGKLYYYFFFLAAIQFCTLILFCIISRRLRIRRFPSPNVSVKRLLGSHS